RSETPTPAQTARLMDLARLAREARLAGDHAGWLEHGQRVLQLAPEHPDLLISLRARWRRMADSSKRKHISMTRYGGAPDSICRRFLNSNRLRTARGCAQSAS